uniref:Uncharacterized protein n=1 Tax=Heterorhabditis bacteriophora TaxID=37862 RepID=A0A1I7XDB3_HETBA
MTRSYNYPSVFFLKPLTDLINMLYGEITLIKC